MIVGVYGVGSLIAATDPLRHWPIVLVGLLGKLFGPVGFIYHAITGSLPWQWGGIIIFNDLIWWLPFAAILYSAWRSGRNVSDSPTDKTWRAALGETKSHLGQTLMELSNEKPTLVRFLRHSGCPFCRADLAELSRRYVTLRKLGYHVAVVHMSHPMRATLLCDRYQLTGVHRFSDPDCKLYRAFGLSRVHLPQLLRPALWWAGFRAVLLQGHGFGTPDGDTWQLPGTFIVSRGRIVAVYRPESPTDQLDLVQFATSSDAVQPEPARRPVAHPTSTLAAP
jgi:peroxiredoxin